MTNTEPPGLWAVVPAAGLGRRFGGTRAKQYHQFAGRTVIEWSISALLALDELAGVMVALAPEDTTWAQLAIAADPRVYRCTGGRQRSDSVASALAALTARGADERDGVLVHDAARPGISPVAIRRLVTATAGTAGGLLALPVVDTLKRGPCGESLGTVDREALWVAQTPQLFPLGALQAALRAAADAGVRVTDEASAMERLGVRPMLVPGDPANLKLTQPKDGELLEAILTLRCRGELT